MISLLMGRTEMPDYLEHSDSGNDLEADQVISYMRENEGDQSVTNLVIQIDNKTHYTNLIMQITLLDFFWGGKVSEILIG